MNDTFITVVGAGVFGLWQALTLARAGRPVRLIEASSTPFTAAASRWAGAMISPDCEAESAPAVVRRLGYEGLQLWQATYPQLVRNGSIVVAQARDRADLLRFARQTGGGTWLDGPAIASVEPALAGRFAEGLYFPNEAHLETPHALDFLLASARAAGVDVRLGQTWQPDQSDGSIVIDCRGFSARSSLPGLRGIRGERLLLRSAQLQLSRPVRLLHPRAAFYVVPWSNGVHMVGATVIESDDASAVTARSALELLGLAYALHPAFGEAEIVDLGAGIRPAFDDNVPRVIVRGRTIHVNGAFRHGFLLAPVMASAVADYLAFGKMRPDIMIVERGSVE